MSICYKLFNLCSGLKKILATISLAPMLVLNISATSSAQQLPKALILTGNSNVPEVKEGYPPWIHEIHDQMISDILQDIVVTEVTSDLNQLNRETLREYDLLISYSMFLTPEPEQLNALYQFISEGKALLTVHSGILSFMNWEKYEEVMGGIFIGGPASVPERFNVNTTNMEFWGYEYSFRDTEEHPVSKTVDNFIIEDELYFFQPSKPDFFVIARANNLPVMWWHPVEKGKVMSYTLGHSEEAKQNEGYQQLLENGVRWLLNYPLIESVDLKPISTRNKNYPAWLRLSDITHADNMQSLNYRVEGSGNITLTNDQDGIIDIELRGEPGTGTISMEAAKDSGRSTQKEFELTVVEDGEGNIASYHGNQVTASSTEPQNFLFDIKNVIDGDLTTRWASDFVDPSWIQIDLQKQYSIGRIVLHYEASYAADYTVQVSETGNSWDTVADIKEGDGETDIITFTPEPARFIKVTGTKRARENYGYSLYEIEVYQE